MLFVYLERFLRDCFIDHMVKNGDARQSIVVPRLLRELLLTSQMESIFGEDIIFLLRLLIGPPTGFNLRNIIWHGFVDERFVVVLVVFIVFDRMN
jgi:hypothetical protein